MALPLPLSGPACAVEAAPAAGPSQLHDAATAAAVTASPPARISRLSGWRVAITNPKRKADADAGDAGDAPRAAQPRLAPPAAVQQPVSARPLSLSDAVRLDLPHAVPLAASTPPRQPAATTDPSIACCSHQPPAAEAAEAPAASPPDEPARDLPAAAGDGAAVAAGAAAPKACEYPAPPAASAQKPLASQAECSEIWLKRCVWQQRMLCAQRTIEISHLACHAGVGSSAPWSPSGRAPHTPRQASARSALLCVPTLPFRRLVVCPRIVGSRLACCARGGGRGHG